MTIVFTRTALRSTQVPSLNGGRFTEALIESNSKNNAWPDVSSAERAAGWMQARKIGIWARDLPLLVNPRVSLLAPSAGDDYTLLYAGDMEDTEATRSGRAYGVGATEMEADAGATLLTVAVESADYATLDPLPFQPGDLVRVDARNHIARPSGMSDAQWEAEQAAPFEYVRLAAGEASVAFDGATLELTLATPTVHAYPVGTPVAAVLETANLAPAVSAVSASGTGGATLDPAQIALASDGTLFQVWTLTCLDGATGLLRIDGDTLGELDTVTRDVVIAPENGPGRVYFSIPPAAWSGGAMATGDEFAFTTSPAATMVWLDRRIPAGAGPLVGASMAGLRVEGES